MDQRAGVAAHARVAKHAGGRRHGALGCTGGTASRGDAGLGILTWRVGPRACCPFSWLYRRCARILNAIPPRAAQKLVDIVAGTPPKVWQVRSIGQTAPFEIVPQAMHRR